MIKVSVPTIISTAVAMRARVLFCVTPPSF
jgi:hypothetical protein